MDVHTHGQITYCGQVTVPPQTQNFSEVVLPLMSFSFLNAPLPGDSTLVSWKISEKRSRGGDLLLLLLCQVHGGESVSTQKHLTTFQGDLARWLWQPKADP